MQQKSSCYAPIAPPATPSWRCLCPLERMFAVGWRTALTLRSSSVSFPKVQASSAVAPAIHAPILVPLSVHDFTKLLNLEWLVHELVPVDDLAMMFSPSGVRKTAWAKRRSRGRRQGGTTRRHSQCGESRRSNPRRAELPENRCRVVVRGKLCCVVVAAEHGERVVTSQQALRHIQSGSK